MVDNNDDIESEDDNDSADAAEAEASPEEADTDNPSPDTDPLLTNTPSPRSTSPPGADQTTDASCRQRRGEVGESEVDNEISLVITKRSGGGDGGGDRDSGEISGGGSANVTENTSDGAAGESRPLDQHSFYANGSGGGGEGGGGGGGAEGENNSTPWTEIEWGQGEGESGGAVRRWGRAVQEGDDYGSTETATSAGDLEPPSITGEAVAGERGKEEEHESPSLEKGISHEAAQTATTPVKGGAGEPPPRSGGRSKKERRRASGSRAPKALVVSNGKSETIAGL